MPKFSYKAKQGPGQIIDDVIEADDLNSAVNKVMALGYAPVEVVPQKDIPAKRSKDISIFSAGAGRVPLSHIAVFTRQMYDLVDSNVPILRALRLVLKQIKHVAFRGIVTDVCTFVENGGSFSDALAKHPRVFSRLYMSMVKAGERGGNLSIVLNRLADFVEKELDVKAKVRMAMFYPSLIMGVGVMTIFILMTFVIPRLTVMFDDLGQTLPLATVILVAVSSIFARFWWLLLGLGVLGGVQLKYLKNTPQGKLWMDTLLLKMPVLGNFIKDVEIGRFSRTLGTLLESGVVIVSALGSVCEVLENEVLRQEIQKVAEEVKKGGSLTKAMGKCAFIPEATVNMMAVGEETGAFERSLYKLADSHERKSDAAVKTLTSLIGPILILCIGTMVGFIVIAVLLPLFQMNMIMQ